ncbi:hypothetical protein B5X24_HaOG202323 [Helicoverpa armigera]|uniref:Uncharacterized protein n=1 Tax=Helicoverpa armigera TaxID=29058 RepID=A0A2W1BV69_HELAM|nr:hypothetical protein B5X24_HaOG202323 [Helicoverpa armigera]
MKFKLDRPISYRVAFANKMPVCHGGVKLSHVLRNRLPAERNIRRTASAASDPANFVSFKPSLDLYKHFKTKISQIGPAILEF